MTVASWKNGISGSWTTAAAWSTGTVPAPGDDVSIAVGGVYTVSITALSLAVHSLTVSDTQAALAIDNALGGGGSNVTVTSALTNSGRIRIGNASLQQATTVTVGALSNTGEIDLTGSSSIQASLFVQQAAPSTLTGKFVLSGDAMLAFQGGAITAIGNSAVLSLSGRKSRVALGSAPGSSSALTQLGSNVGNLTLANGATVQTTVDFLNDGLVNLDNAPGNGSSRLTIGGALTNRGTVVIGNDFLTGAAVLTTTNLINAGEIDLIGSSAGRAMLKVTSAAPSTFTGINEITGNAVLQYASGGIHNIVIGSRLTLDGAEARVALSSTPNSNSALKTLEGNAGTFELENGATVKITGDFANTGATMVDTDSGAGGSRLTIGGTLTNSALISPNGLKIGNKTLSATTLVTAAALSNTGETDVTGAPSVQATLSVSGAAPTKLNGIIKLTNDALLQYGSGAITDIDTGAALFLSGANARVAVAGQTASNSALTNLATNQGTLSLGAGARVSTNTGINFSNSSLVQVDAGAGDGGSRLTIGGTLINNALTPKGIKIGNLTLVAETTVTAANLSNSGEIDITGGQSVQASLKIAGAAPASLSGTYKLVGDALLQFGSGAVTSIGSGATLLLNGADARVGLAAAPAGNSALKKLSNNAGTLDLENGAHIATTVAFSNTFTVNVDTASGSGGSSLSIGGTLTNNSIVRIGNTALMVPTTVTAAGLTNGGEIDLTGTPNVQATLQIAQAAPSTLTGINKLTNSALLQYGSGAITSISGSATLVLSGAAARVALASSPADNSALITLGTNAGVFDLENGASVMTSVGLDNTGTVKVDASSAGGSHLGIGGIISNSGSLTIGNVLYTVAATTVQATGLQNLIGGKVTVSGRAAPSTLSLDAASGNAGSINIGSGGVLALGNTLTVTGSLTLSGGTIIGGTLAGSGVIGSSNGSASALTNLSIDAGATFVAGAGSTLTVSHVTVNGQLDGGGSAELQFGSAGVDKMAHISGFPIIDLADGGANTLTLTNNNFVNVTNNTITVYGGESNNTITGAALSSAHSMIVYAGIGTDTLTGGAGNDVFYATGHTTMTGNGGQNEFAFYSPGPDNVVTDFGVNNKFDFSDFGFALDLPGASSTPQALPSGLVGDLANGSFNNSTERFAYDQGTGHLIFDADGNGSGSTAQTIATLAGNPGVTGTQLFFVT